MTPWTIAHQTPLSTGLPRQEYWSWLPFPPPGDLPELRTSLVAQMVKNLPAMQESRVWSLGREDPLEKGMATHSSTLVWRISWTKEPHKLQFTELQRVSMIERLTLSLSWPSNPTPGHISGESHNSKRHMHPSVHGSTIYKPWKQLRCPSEMKG